MARPFGRGVLAGGEQSDVRDAYGVALMCLLGSMLLLIATNASLSEPITIVAIFLQFGALILTLRVSGVRRRPYIGSIVVVSAVMAVSLVAIANWGAFGDGLAHIGWLLLTLATMAAIARRLATYQRVTFQLVLGLLCIYLLVGMAFGLSYAIVEIQDPAAFTQPLNGMSTALYFSFVTLATVGYGDITAVDPLARAIVIGESILGQLYLVSVVSLAVSRLGTEKQDRSASKENA